VPDLVRLAERARIRCPGLLDGNDSIRNADLDLAESCAASCLPGSAQRMHPLAWQLSRAFLDWPTVQSTSTPTVFSPAQPEIDDRRLQCALQILAALCSSSLAPQSPSHRRPVPQTPRTAETLRCNGAWPRLGRPQT